MQSGKHFSREGYSRKIFAGSDSESIVFLRQRYTKKNHVDVLKMLYANNIILYGDVEFDNETCKDSIDNQTGKTSLSSEG